MPEYSRRHNSQRKGSRPRSNSRAQDERRLSPDAPERLVADPRLFAQRVLRRVIDTDAYANLLLPAKIAQTQRRTSKQIARRDIGFITEIVYGTLRRQGSYDAIIESASSRSIQTLDLDVLVVLRMAAHQCFHMRVPNHAMVAASVDLISDIGMSRAKGLVNAVCRRMSERSWDEWMERVTVSKTTDDKLAIEYSHPVWIVAAFRRALAVDGRSDDIVKLLESDNVNPVVNLVALPGLATPADFASLPGARESHKSQLESSADSSQQSASDVNETKPLPDYSPIGGAMPAGVYLDQLPAGIRVQDQGSQIAALAMVNAKPISRAEQWADVCAGPGGKAVLLAAVAAQHHAEFVCNELAPHRAELVAEALSVIPHPPVVHSQDARDFLSGKTFDRILLDAPCTGLGALRRRPEARWRKSADSVRELMGLQQQLLQASFDSLNTDGVLAYVTCSPHIAETRNQVQRCLKANPTAKLLDSRAILQQVSPGIPLGANAFGVQLWPHIHATDAMFVSLITKVQG